MTKALIKQAAILGLTPILIVSLATQAPAAKTAKTIKTKVTKSATAVGDKEGVKAHLQSLSRAVRTGDSKGLAALWAEECIFIDEDGVQTKGRNDLERRFAEVFTTRGKPPVDLVAETITFPAPNVATVDGTVVGQATNSPTTRFTMLLTRSGDGWLVTQATETPIRVRTAEDRLRELEWLVGDWSAERSGASVRMNAQWAPKKNFILLTYTSKMPLGEERVDKQIIGWDPRNEKIVSWVFDSTGGFGYGTWSHKDNQWVVDASGVQQDGSTTSAVNVISVQDPNSFSWQSVNRTVDGIALSDTAELKVTRVAQISSR